MNGKNKYAAPQQRELHDISSRCLVYHGPSMNPLFKDLDIAYYIPYNEQQMRTGDIVVFQIPGGQKKVIHRIISVDPEGIRTRGDNNPKIDSWILSPDNIIGRVTHIMRGKKMHSISSRLPARLLRYRAAALLWTKSLMIFLTRPPYRWISRKRILSRFLFTLFRPHFLAFEKPSGTEYQLLFGKKVIGRLPPSEEKWHIQPPFRLFVDELSLRSFTQKTDNPKRNMDYSK
jgi:signal peptidase I